MFADRAMFTDRTEAGRRLAGELGRFKGEDPVVLALPRGGVPVGLEIAKALDAPLDLVMVRKVGAPFQRELAVAAVVDGARAETVLNDEIVRELQIPDDYIEAESARELEEIERRRKRYLEGRERVPVTNATAILVDDGIATGTTMQAALRATRRQQPRRLVLAVPVAPPDTLERLRPEVDEMICLATPRWFAAIGSFYRDFEQLSDDDVVRLLREAPSARRPVTEPPRQA